MAVAERERLTKDEAQDAALFAHPAIADVDPARLGPRLGAGQSRRLPAREVESPSAKEAFGQHHPKRVGQKSPQPATAPKRVKRSRFRRVFISRLSNTSRSDPNEGKCRSVALLTQGGVISDSWRRGSRLTFSTNSLRSARAAAQRRRCQGHRKAVYVDDLPVAGAIYGVTVRSKVARGHLRGITYHPGVPWKTSTLSPPPTSQGKTPSR